MQLLQSTQHDTLVHQRMRIPIVVRQMVLIEGALEVLDVPLLLAELEADVPSQGSQTSVSSAAAGSPQLSASAAAEGSQQQHGEFIVSRSVPPPPAPPALPNVQQLDAAFPIDSNDKGSLSWLGFIN
jgi:hypothetical protein